jgi:hypothetical protein
MASVLQRRPAVLLVGTCVIWLCYSWLPAVLFANVQQPQSSACHFDSGINMMLAAACIVPLCLSVAHGHLSWLKAAPQLLYEHCMRCSSAASSAWSSSSSSSSGCYNVQTLETLLGGFHA